jgi:hypothetical protein
MLSTMKGWFAHSRTILAARLYALAGAIVGIHDQVLPIVSGSGVDWKPLLPPQYLPLVMIGGAVVFETLRWVTTGPVGRKDGA